MSAQLSPLPEPTNRQRIHLPAISIRKVDKNRWLAALPNGHQVSAILPKKNPEFAKEILPGRKITLDSSPYDLSRGNIIGCS